MKNEQKALPFICNRCGTEDRTTNDTRLFVAQLRARLHNDPPIKGICVVCQFYIDFQKKKEEWWDWKEKTDCRIYVIKLYLLILAVFYLILVYLF